MGICLKYDKAFCRNLQNAFKYMLTLMLMHVNCGQVCQALFTFNDEVADIIKEHAYKGGNIILERTSKGCVWDMIAIEIQE